MAAGTHIDDLIATVREGKVRLVDRARALRIEARRRYPEDEIVAEGGAELAAVLSSLEAARLRLRRAEGVLSRFQGVPVLARLVERFVVPTRRDVMQARTDLVAVRKAAWLRLRRRDQRLKEIRSDLRRMSEIHGRLSTIAEGLERAQGNGATVLSVDTRSKGWVEAMERILLHHGNGVASVVAKGADVDGLDLSPRGRAVAIGVVGDTTLSDRPWERLPRDERWYFRPENLLEDGLPGFVLKGRRFGYWPRALLAPRERSAIPWLKGSYGNGERIYLPVSVARVDEVVAAGGVMGKRGGLYVDPREVDLGGPISRFLPFIAQKWYAPLPPAHVPRSAWGASLAQLLTRSRWQALRKGVFDRYGGLCQICGQLRGGKSLECHEVWDYLDEPLVDGMRVQRLAGLMCLCKYCHGSLHQGRSTMKGCGDASAYRLADINGWTMAEMEIVEHAMDVDQENRSGHRWALDLSILAGGRPLVLDSNRCGLTEAGHLSHGGGDDRRTTRIIGVEYRMSKDDVVHSGAV